MNETRGIIFDIKRFAVHDGPGIRTTVFFKGCPMRCPWCHNPESWKMAPQEIEGRGMVGRETGVDEIMREIEKEVVFFDESGGGVTFSGGEPLMQPEFLKELTARCRGREITVTLDTTGYTDPALFDRLTGENGPDLVLFDLKIMDDTEHKRHTGVSNVHVLHNLRSLCRKGRRVIVRFPVIPGYTDSDDNIRMLGEQVRALEGKKVEAIHLLPYHRTGNRKFRDMGLEYEPENRNIKPPSREWMDHARKRLETISGVPVSQPNR